MTTNTHHLKNKLTTSALGATVAAAALPALLLFGGAPTAQSASAPLSPIHFLPLDPNLDAQVAAADAQLKQAEADYNNASRAQDVTHSTLAGWQNKLGPATDDMNSKWQALQTAQGHLSEEKMIPGPLVQTPGCSTPGPVDACGMHNNVTDAQNAVEKAKNDYQSAKAVVDQINLEINTWKPAADNADANYTKAASALSAASGQDMSLHQQQGTPPPK